VRGILADVNIEGHVRRLLQLLQEEPRREFWTYLNLLTPVFADLGLLPTDSDLVVWRRCQLEQLVLITTNRNQTGPDSLEAVIRTLNRPDSLPVVTLANPQRFRTNRQYAVRVADRLLDYLFDIDSHRGAGRLYVP
jgi:hypothetical protein